MHSVAWITQRSPLATQGQEDLSLRLAERGARGERATGFDPSGGLPRAPASSTASRAVQHDPGSQVVDGGGWIAGRQRERLECPSARAPPFCVPLLRLHLSPSIKLPLQKTQLVSRASIGLARGRLRRAAAAHRATPFPPPQLSSAARARTTTRESHTCFFFVSTSV
jgi:hypothetical protein